MRHLKVAIEALTVALDDYYDVRWGKPYDHTGINIKSEVMPMQLMRRVVRSILATGVVVYKSTAKGIEVAEPFEFELVFTGSASNPRPMARLPGDHLQTARRPGPSAWKVAWSRPSTRSTTWGPPLATRAGCCRTNRSSLISTARPARTRWWTRCGSSCSRTTTSAATGTTPGRRSSPL